MSGDQLIVLRPRTDEGVAAADRLFDEVVDGLRPALCTDEPETALEHVRTQPDALAMVVIGPGVADPLDVGRRIRLVDQSVGLSYVVEPGRAEILGMQIGMVSELRDAAVIVAAGPPRELTEELRARTEATARRRDVSRAVELMNRQLVTGLADRGRREASTVPERYLAAIVRHVPEAILSIDHDHRVVTFNQAAAELFGLRLDLSTDVRLQDLLGDQPDLQAPMERALAGATTTGVEVKLGTGGAPVLVSVTAAPVRDHAEEIIGAVLVARDISTQRRTEERLRQLQKAESLATLAGGVAHDFNNLLVTVRSWAQLAAEDPDDPELVAQALERIEHSATRAAELSRSMLVYSGRGRFELEPVDVNVVVRETAELLHGAINRKIQLRLELTDGLPHVEGAVIQLRQVLVNLVTNAAEAIGDAAGTITVRSHPLSPEKGADTELLGGSVVVEVADDGPGMDDETLTRVFEPFFTTKFQGRGLGLAASFGIVRAHNGTLTVSSSPGQGATFRMILPAAHGGRSV